MQSFIAEKTEKLSKACLSRICGLSYNVFSRLLKDKDVKINGKRVNKDINVCVGDIIEIYYNRNAVLSYTTIFEDDNVCVINKKGGYTSENIYEQLCQIQNEIYFIHRLDRNTKGLMIFAKNKASEQELLKGFKNHTFIKEYKAEVYGKFNKKEEILTAYLVKDSEKSVVKIYDNQVKNSVLIKTGYKVIKELEDTTIISVRLYTGKTHQIRAHLSHIGHFIMGDGKYGNDVINKEKGYKEQQLCSYKLTLVFDKTSPLFYLNNNTFCVE